MLTREDVKSAAFAKACDSLAETNGTSGELEAAYELEGKHREAALSEYRRGKDLLDKYRVVQSRKRYRAGTAITNRLISDDAPTVLLPAGYIAGHEAVVQVTLCIK